MIKTIPKQPEGRPRHRWWSRQVHYYYYRLLRLRDSPEAIARGAAVGVFWGFFPFFGLQTLLSVVVATLVRGNRWVAMVATWVSNPFTYVPIYGFNFHVGQAILRAKDIDLTDVDWTSSDLFYLGGKFALALGLGCFVVGSIVAMLTYSLTVPALYRLRRLRRHRCSRP